MSAPSTDEIRQFWEAHPVGDKDIASRAVLYDYFRAFDDLREHADVEPLALSEHLHGYRGSTGLRVLDYGCGNGYVLAHYARNGALVSGIDLTERALSLARARFNLLDLRGEFVKGDGKSVPFPDGTFDIVCSMGVLHHIPDPRPVIAELYRVLKPGGRLVVMVYSRASWRYRVLYRWRQRFDPAARGKALQDLVNDNDGAGNPWGDVYSQDELRHLLDAFIDHRFEIHKLGAPEMALNWAPLAHVLARALPRRAVRALAARWGWNLYGMARKPA